MGWLNLFKREVPEPSFEFDELERIFGNLQLKSLSIDKAAEFVEIGRASCRERV